MKTQPLTMKHYRVTIKYKTSNQMGSISATVPAFNDTHAINIIIDSNGLTGKVMANKAELLKRD